MAANAAHANNGMDVVVQSSSLDVPTEVFEIFNS
jgi:hypothetical protein